MITVNKIDELLKYFHQELAYLRNKGEEFAERYPKIAGALELGPDGSTDPHVERLIESVAFLTARMQRDIQKKFPEYTQQILGGLYPHLTTPVPSITMAKFDVDVTKLKSLDGFLVPKETPLFLNDLDGNTCFFKTCYATKLWPITVENVRVVDLNEIGISRVGLPKSKGLAISLQSHGVPFNKLKLRHLDFFLQGERSFTHKIYDAVMTNASSIYLIENGTGKARLMPSAKYNPKGFDVSEQLLPMPGNSHPAYAVLMDYFAFPKKFHYLSIWDIDFSHVNDVCEIVLPLSNESIREVRPHNMCLGAVPIVNLFEKSTEPLKLDHTAIKYKLTPDIRRESTTEIHSIQNVVVINDQSGDVESIPPYFAYKQWNNTQQAQRSWHMEREPSQYGGFDLYLSFVDQTFDPQVLTNATVYAETLCTNRLMAEDIPVGSLLNSLIDIPTKSIQTLMQASTPKMVADTDSAYWNLIAHLNLNHLSLTSLGAEGLKSLLKLYGNESNTILIDGIVDAEQHFVTRRLTTDAWRGFVQGVEIILTLDERNFEGESSLIFGSVLRQFLALYTSINSFVELKLKWKHTGKIWKEWTPLSGRQHLL
jgi:type VI secretion system protein ImpG